MRAFLYFFVCIVIFIGCGKKSSQELLPYLNKDMTLFEVKEKLGDPDQEEELGQNKVMLIYKVTDGYVIVYLVNGEVEDYRRTDRILFR